MRGLALFLACFLPALGFLIWAGGDSRAPSAIPARDPESPDTAVLLRSDLADVHGESPLPGRLLRLDGLVMRAVEEGSLRYELSMDGLARVEGKPRLSGIHWTAFESKNREAPRISFVLTGGFLEADPAAFLDGARGESRLLWLGGGIAVADDRGRPLVDIPTGVLLELPSERISTALDVTLRHPEEDVEIRARGLIADQRRRTVVLERAVEVAFPWDGERAQLSARGPASVRESDLRIVMRDSVHLRHPRLEMRCARLEAALRRDAAGKLSLATARLDGGVEVTVAPALAGGLRFLRAKSAYVPDPMTILLLGPVEAEREGEMDLFGQGKRRLSLRAGLVVLRLGRTGRPGQFESLRAGGGVSVRDLDGGGEIRAHDLWTRAGFLELCGAVRGVTARGTLSATRLRALRIARDASVLLLSGPSSGRFPSRDGEWNVASHGDVTIFAGVIGRVVTAQGGVEGSLPGEKGLSLRARSLNALLAGDQVLLADAAGEVTWSQAARKATGGADALHFRKEGVRMHGSPAWAAEGDRRVEARRILYRPDSQEFEAEGDVDLRAPVEGGLWRIRCGTLTARLMDEKTLKEAVASGGVIADGPGGEHLEGASFTLADTKARLVGEPALLRRGDGLELAAPGLDFTIRRGEERWELAEASTTGASVLNLAASKEDPRGPRRWRILLPEAAHLRGETLDLPGGAKVEGFDAAGRTIVSGRAEQATVLLKRGEGGWEPVRVEGRGGVHAEGAQGSRNARIDADRLVFEPATRRLALEGNVRIRAEGYAADARFRRAEVILGDNGLEIVSASGIVMTRN